MITHNHIISFLPSKGYLTQNEKIQHKILTNILSNNKDLIEYLEVIINNYNDGKYEIDEFMEIKKTLTSLPGEELLIYKDAIFEILNMPKEIQQSIVERIDPSSTLLNSSMKYNMGKLLSIMCNMIHIHTKTISKIITLHKKLIGYIEFNESIYDIKSIENNINLIEYLKRDVLENADNFYNELPNAQLDKEFASIINIEIYENLIRKIKNNNINKMNSYLTSTEIYLKNRLEILKDQEIKVHVSKCVKKNNDYKIKKKGRK